MVNDEHPSDETIAAFLDGGLTAPERATVAQHLASCDDCRALLGVQAAEPSKTRGTRPLWIAVGSVAAAAVLMFAIVPRSRPAATEVARIRSPSGSTVETSELVARSPSGGATVAIDTLVLRWASAGSGTTYDVTIVDDAGALVWNTRIDSANVAPPRDVTARLRAGRTYYWRADALLPDLRTASTGPQGFVPAER